MDERRECIYHTRLREALFLFAIAADCGEWGFGVRFLWKLANNTNRTTDIRHMVGEGNQEKWPACSKRVRRPWRCASSARCATIS
ncbi:hypothetical protein D9M68_987080 [compost metagenome]